MDSDDLKKAGNNPPFILKNYNCIKLFIFLKVVLNNLNQEVSHYEFFGEIGQRFPKILKKKRGRQ